MSDKRLQEIQDRLDNLAYNTPPWSVEHDSVGTDINFGDHYQVEDADGDLVAACENEPVAVLLLHAPADLAWLIQAHYRLQSRIAYLEGRLGIAEHNTDEESQA